MFIICTSLLFFTCSVPVYTQEKTQTKYMKLENGLQVFLYERHNQPMVNIVIAVNLGSKDESDDTNGLVHILEHYIQFRGIKLRSGQNMSEDIRKYGAYFNAHTGRDLSLFETSAPSEHADFALKYQKELLFNLKLTQEELEKEKKVILEELNQIQDDPIKYSTSLVFQNLYRNHPYSRAIHGKMEK